MQEKKPRLIDCRTPVVIENRPGRFLCLQSEAPSNIRPQEQGQQNREQDSRQESYSEVVVMSQSTGLSLRFVSQISLTVLASSRIGCNRFAAKRTLLQWFDDSHIATLDIAPLRFNKKRALSRSG